MGCLVLTWLTTACLSRQAVVKGKQHLRSADCFEWISRCFENDGWTVLGTRNFVLASAAQTIKIAVVRVQTMYRSTYCIFHNCAYNAVHCYRLSIIMLTAAIAQQ